MDYSFFDGLLDGVFVINDGRGVVYCNDAAARLCESSVRRMARGKPIHQFIEFSDTNLFVMPNGTVGQDAPAPYIELTYKIKSGKEGKIQVAIQPFSEPGGEKRWVVMLRDVTVEEVLHAKYHKQLEEKEIYIQQLQEAKAQLEHYSKNLEKMVEERTLEIKKANVMLNAIMNSLGQGFLVFDKKGVCSDFYTKACEDILEVSPAKKNITEVLRVQGPQAESFAMWKDAVFSEKLPFEAIKELGPSRYQHSQDRFVKLDYFPLRDDVGSISDIVMVATDQTSEHLANVALEKEKKFARMVVKLVTSKKPFAQFLEGVEPLIQDVRDRLSEKEGSFDHEYVFRALHTLEGEAATYSVGDVWASSRRAQEVLEPLKQGLPINVGEVKASLNAALDALQVQYSEFLKMNAELFQMVGIGSSDKVEVDVVTIDRLLLNLKRRGLSEESERLIEDALLKEPILHAFRHYADVVQSVATKLSKEVFPVRFDSMELRVYLKNYQNLFSSFIHAFRNAVDHGIEPPEEREMAGKARAGQIVVRAERFENRGSWIRILVEDDGKGISAEELRARLASQGAKGPGSHESDFDIIQHVFDSGVSTKEEIGEFSGRGIGMNAIRAEAESLGGRAWVESEVGKGTKLIVEVPDFPRVASSERAA